MQGGGGKPGVDCPPTSLAAMHAGAAVIVDAGFSSTTIAPFFDGRLLESSVRRINLGGKLLTNYFKELVSYRCVLGVLGVEMSYGKQHVDVEISYDCSQHVHAVWCMYTLVHTCLVQHPLTTATTQEHQCHG